MTSCNNHWVRRSTFFAAAALMFASIAAGAIRADEHRAASDRDPPVHTFSIVAFDPATGDLGIAVASKVLGVGSIVPWAKANVGAIATQSAANTSYGPEGLELLEAGENASTALQRLIDADEGRAHRQLGIVDAKGRPASFTGEECIEWAGQVVGDHYAVQGNLLAGEEVVQAMAAAYEDARRKEGAELAEWLLAALAAGDKAGGDKRGKQSAALLVVRDKAGYGQNDRYVDLRVDDHADPLPELARLFELHKEMFDWPHRHPPVRTNYPEPTAGDFVIRDFKFRTGESLAELRMHYLTLGQRERDDRGVVRNAVLVLHGTTGSGGQFLRPEFANELFGPGQPLDASKFYIIIPDNVGHGASSKPSDGLHADFPRYGYRDMIEAQRLLLTEGLDVDHLRLILGTSMGGMHAWLWGQLHPDFMDGLVPLASLPTQISGRNRMWRRVIIDAIRHDPQWLGGDYTAQPPALRTAVAMLFLMGSNPVKRQQEAPTLAAADRVLDRHLADRWKAYDANDVLYAVEASHDYDPGPGLEKIVAPLLAINSADDLINPPELGVLEREIKRVPHGRAITIPPSDRTSGHGTHTSAAVWKDELAKFLEETEPEP